MECSNCKLAQAVEDSFRLLMEFIQSKLDNMKWKCIKFRLSILVECF